MPRSYTDLVEEHVALGEAISTGDKQQYVERVKVLRRDIDEAIASNYVVGNEARNLSKISAQWNGILVEIRLGSQRHADGIDPEKMPLLTIVRSMSAIHWTSLGFVLFTIVSSVATGAFATGKYMVENTSVVALANEKAAAKRELEDAKRTLVEADRKAVETSKKMASQLELIGNLESQLLYHKHVAEFHALTNELNGGAGRVGRDDADELRARVRLLLLEMRAAGEVRVESDLSTGMMRVKLREGGQVWRVPTGVSRDLEIRGDGTQAAE